MQCGRAGLGEPYAPRGSTAAPEGAACVESSVARAAPSVAARSETADSAATTATATAAAAAAAGSDTRGCDGRGTAESHDARDVQRDAALAGASARAGARVGPGETAIAASRTAAARGGHGRRRGVQFGVGRLGVLCGRQLSHRSDERDLVRLEQPRASMT